MTLCIPLTLCILCNHKLTGKGCRVNGRSGITLKWATAVDI